MKKLNRVSVAVLVVTFALVISAISAFALSSALAPGAINLGTAGSFAVLAGSGIVSTNPPQVITGDAGSNPTVSNGLSSTTDFVAGTNYTASNAAVIAAKVALANAYGAATSTATTTTIVTELGGQTLTAGVYDSAAGTFGLTGGLTLTLNGGGNPDAVFIFKMASTLTTGNASIVALTGGAQACNVFWQVGSSATLLNTTFVGTILAKTSITDSGSSTVSGRFLADADNDTTGAVTLNHTHVTVPTCAPTLTVTKVVVNTGGGTKGVSDFPLFIDGMSVTSGVASTTLSGSHTVSETSNSSYASVISGDCGTNGTINLVAGTANACTITNTYIPPTPAAPSSFSPGGSTTYGCKDPNASNYNYFSASNPALCVYTATSTIVYRAIATTTVASPKLPNTGIGDQTSITVAQAVAIFNRPLGTGMSGVDVTALQTALVEKGFLVIPIKITKGYYGALTRSAVLKYQAHSSLPLAGVFGPMTKAKLISELSN
jgi:hypothetical protein